MPTIWGTRRGDFIYPYARFVPALRDMPEDVRLRVKLDTDRNGKFSALYHVMLGMVVDAINRGPAQTTIDNLKKWVKIQRGWYSVIPLPNPTGEGVEHAIEYKSTTFNKMGEREFHEFAVDTCEMIATDLAPWIKESPEWPEIQAIVAQIAPEAA